MEIGEKISKFVRQTHDCTQLLMHASKINLGGNEKNIERPSLVWSEGIK